MASIGKIARRTVLFGGLAIAGGAAFGAWAVTRPAPNPLRPGDGQTVLGAFVIIDQDGVSLIAPRAEMGQGTQTTWAALIAEELDVAWDSVRVLHGPPAQAYFNSAAIAEALPNKGYDVSEFTHGVSELMGQLGKVMRLQITGGSTAMKDGFERMRLTGAATREALKSVAADRLGIPAAQLRTEDGTVVAPDGTTLRYADLAPDAVGVDPGPVQLRPQSEWRLLGTSLPRKDIVGKSTGTAAFGVDTRLPGLRFAALRRAPHRGGMDRFDADRASRMPGVEKVVDLGDGVAVVATNTWLAQQAVDAVEITWGDPAPYPSDTDAMFAALEAGFDTEPDSVMRDDGNVDRAARRAAVIEAEYRVPFLAHTTMEPMNATAWITADGLQVWCGNQAPIAIRDFCAAEAGLSSDRVTVETTYMGGGFGRRAETDFAVLATRVAAAMPGTPVQLTWSREEDMTHDFYRPASIARMRGAVEDGRAVMIDAAISGPPLTAQTLERWDAAAAGPDKALVDGLFNQPYAVPNYRVRGHLADLQVPVGFWRSVGASNNGFYHESFVDELALAAGADPLAFRMTMAKDEWRPAARVLEAVGEMSNWTGQTPDGIGRGVAMVYSFGTPCAVVIEVADQDGAIRLTHAWIAADPGTILDPSICEAQLTGGMAHGLSAAMGEEITFADGVVQQTNFPDYEPMRISQMPKTEVRLIEVQKRLGGIGEVGTPPAAPALANALYDLTGIRARSLPLRHQFTFAL